MSISRSDISDIGNRPYYELHTCHLGTRLSPAMDYKGIGVRPDIKMR